MTKLFHFNSFDQVHNKTFLICHRVDQAQISEKKINPMKVSSKNLPSSVKGGNVVKLIHPWNFNCEPLRCQRRHIQRWTFLRQKRNDRRVIRSHNKTSHRSAVYTLQLRRRLALLLLRGEKKFFRRRHESCTSRW